MKVKITAFLCVILQSLWLNGQHADCANLLVLKDTIYQSKAIEGFGTVKEFNGNKLADKKLFAQESNSIWYLINVPSTGVLTFDIVGKSNEDDWDFLLYAYAPNLCASLRNKTIKPIRSNLSRSSTTGTSSNATASFVGAGLHSNYSKALNVVQGNQYVLIVNNPKRAGGKHTLKLHLKPNINQLPIAQELKKQVTQDEKQPLNKTQLQFTLTLIDAKSEKAVSAYGTIQGLQKEVVELNEVSSYQCALPKTNRNIIIAAYAKGYMLTSKTLKLGKKKSSFLTQVFLEKIEPNKSVNLPAIQFYEDRVELLPTAKPSLEILLAFMKKNPTVVVEIEGHVNGPRERNTKLNKELSAKRAGKVRLYLIDNGVAKDRIKIKGYGNSKMIYPDPKNELQAAINRRVAVKILAK